MQDIPLKCCSKCQQFKPATSDFFAKDSSAKDGLFRWCKMCNAEHCKRYHYTHREHRLSQKRQYRETHKEEIAFKHRAWYADHRAHKLSYNRAHYARHRATYEAKRHIYVAKNAEYIATRRKRYNQTHAAQNAAAYRRWRLNNKAKVNAKVRNRDAKRRRAEGVHTAEDVQKQYERQQGCCYYCGEHVGDRYHVDHVIPLSRGGTNWPDNIVIACPRCNEQKGDKLPHEWSKGGKLL